MAMPLNMARICRTCLCETDGLTSMFNMDYQQNCKIFKMISVCSNMKIEENDGLPDKICAKCVESARSAFAFKQQCDIAYRTLRTLVEQHNSIDVTANTKETQTDGTGFQQCSRTNLSKNTLQETSFFNLGQKIEPPAQCAISADNSRKCIVEVPKKDLFLEVEYVQDAAEIGTDEKINFTAIDVPCKVEIFEDVEYLAETFEHVVKQIKNEPTTEHESNKKLGTEDQCDAECSNESTGYAEDDNDVSENDQASKKLSPRTQMKGSSARHTCDYCNKTFGRATHLRRHMLTHTNEKNFKCRICARAFARSDHLAIHETTFHSQERPFACQLCEKSFKRSEHLRTHVESKHSDTVADKKQEICDICNKGFSTAKSLESHKKAHLEQKTYNCKFCEEQFAEKDKHREHMKQAHLQGKAFLCSECGQSFVRNDYLLIHMRRHKGIKPYKCKFCPKAFPRATDLRVHEKYHTNEKAHLCTICGKGFHRAYNLLVHSRTHNGLKPYQCPHCPKSFAQGNDLKAHVRRHTGERYKCDICDEGFIQCYQLNNHKRAVHNIDTATNARRVTKFLTPTAQEQQMLLQQHHQQLEQLVAQQRELEEQQQGWSEESVPHDPDLEKKILETKERIQDVERELEEINSRLHEEIERQHHRNQEAAEGMLDVNNEEYSPNSSFGHQFLSNPNIPHSSAIIKFENSR